MCLSATHLSTKTSTLTHTCPYPWPQKRMHLITQTHNTDPHPYTDLHAYRKMLIQTYMLIKVFQFANFTNWEKCNIIPQIFRKLQENFVFFHASEKYNNWFSKSIQFLRVFCWCYFFNLENIYQTAMVILYKKRKFPNLKILPQDFGSTIIMVTHNNDFFSFQTCKLII